MRFAPDIRRATVGLLFAALLLAVVLIAAAPAASAAEATEAEVFGADGIATQSLGFHDGPAAVEAVTARPDGGVIAEQQGQVRQLLADGSPDLASPPPVKPKGFTFPATGGKSLRIENDRLLRLDPDGTPDPSFGSGGSVAISTQARGAIELPSGKVAVLTLTGKGARVFRVYAAITVLKSDGSADGKSISLGALGYDGYAEWPVEEIEPAPDGGALVVAQGFLIRLGADGRPDPGFGQKGIVQASIAGAHFLGDGSIEAVGSSFLPKEKTTVPELLRFSPSGAPAASYGQGGTEVFGLPDWTGVNAVSWGPDGSVIVGGRTVVRGQCIEETCEEAPALAAFGPGGELDTAFGSGGVLRLAALAGAPLEKTSSGVLALARRPDGSIVAAGSAPPNQAVGFVAALSPQGALLPGFGEGGIVRLSNTAPATERVSGLAALPDGGVLAAGASDVGPAEHAVLVRYAPDGSLDPGFGSGGHVDLAPTGEATTVTAGGNVALVTSGVYPRARLSELDLEGGTPVASFGSGGTVGLPRGLVPHAVALQPDGKALVFGETRPHGGLVLVRFDPDGGRDRSFGTDGEVTLRSPGGSQMRARSLALAAGGRILLAGPAGTHFAVARLLPGGKLDRRFGTRGWSLTKVVGATKSTEMALDGGRIDLAGNVQALRGNRLVLVRLRADGRLERRFGHGGFRSTAAGSSAGLAAVVPSGAGGVTVALEHGSMPLVDFAADGAVVRSALGTSTVGVHDVEAVASGGRLIAGFTPYLQQKAEVPGYYLSSGALEP
jgi:uncharacterized delta-60 repeat protein